MTAIFKHHDLTVERTGDQITLTQQADYSEPDMVMLHPWQLRAVCEEFGLIPTSDPTVARHIATLERRLHLLRDRIDHLAYHLSHNSDTAHADLDYVQTYATATGLIAGTASQFRCDARHSVGLKHQGILSPARCCCDA